MDFESTMNLAVEKAVRVALAAYRNEEERKRKDPRILIVKSDAEKMSGGRNVLASLEKRGYISPYQFDIAEMIDEDGNPIKKAKGRIYYKLSELTSALEDGNILKDLKKMKRRSLCEY